MNREVHAPFCERPAGEIPPAYSPRHNDEDDAAARPLPQGPPPEELGAIRPLETQTFIADLRCDGLTAPFVVDRPMHRRIFETYV